MYARAYSLNGAPEHELGNLDLADRLHFLRDRKGLRGDMTILAQLSGLRTHAA